MNEAAIQYIQSLRLDPFPNPDYRVVRNLDQLYEYILPTPHINLYGSDTESLPDGSPFCVTISHTPGTGRLIYVEDVALLYELGLAISGEPSLDYLPWELVFHNYLHDSDVFDILGLPYPIFHDTMVRAYNLCLGGGGDDDDEESRAGRGSLGLKTLVYRLCNMRMTSFKETVTPHSVKFAVRWLEQVEELFRKEEYIPICTCGCPVDLHQLKGIKRPSHTGPCSNCNCEKCKRVKKPKATDEDKRLDSVYTKTTNLLEALLLGEDVDPWNRVKGWEDSYTIVQEIAGPIPPRSVAHVPEPQLLQYACGDADGALRLHLKLKTHYPWLFF